MGRFALCFFYYIEKRIFVFMILPEKITKLIIRLKFILIKATSSSNKTLVEIAEKYFKLRAGNILHEEAISKIIKQEYSDKLQIDKAIAFVYKRKDFLDMTFEKQYGKKGLPLAHLIRISQRIFADRYFDEEKKDDRAALVDLAYKMKKNFNIIVLTMFDKYPIK